MGFEADFQLAKSAYALHYGGVVGAVRIWGLLINEEWPTFDDNLIAPDATKEISWVIALINEIRSTRSAANINVKSKVQVLMKNLIRSDQLR